jgi:hypothetical protein
VVLSRDIFGRFGIFLGSPGIFLGKAVINSPPWEYDIASYITAEWYSFKFEPKTIPVKGLY